MPAPPSKVSGRPALEGAFYTTHWHPDLRRPEAAGFVASYRRAHGVAPGTGAALAYDGFRLLFAALEKAASADPDAIRRELARLDRFPAVTGTLSYRAGGDPAKSVVVVEIRGGASRPFAIVEP